MKRGPSIRLVLLGVNVLILLIPVTAIAVLRFYDIYLLRQTERQLIAQSVVIAEVWREAWRGQGAGADRAIRPPGRFQETYTPYEPTIDIGIDIGSPLPEATRRSDGSDNRARRAGARVEPLLRRAQVFNLSAIRILDDEGCVVATTRGEVGLCLDRFPEVRDALRGEYAARARERISDEPAPPLGDVRRRGQIYVFTALPVFSDGKVIGVVRASRTGLDALSSLWLNRRGFVLFVLSIVLITVFISLFFSAAIASPVRAITRYARSVVSGEPGPALRARPWTPSEMRVLGESLDTMTAKLTDRAAYASEFAATASHELKTPITAIRGAAELLGEKWDEMEPTQRRRFLDNIEQDAGRMERLVTGLLELARIENAAREMPGEVEVRDFLSALTAPHGEQVELIIDDGVPETIRIHSEHLAAAVGNLLANAVRHGAGKPVTVRVSTARGRLAVSVRDRGPGIRAANQKRIFGRFFTTERDAGGTGLGLSIVKAIVDARGGSIACESDEGGTLFTITL